MRATVSRRSMSVGGLSTVGSVNFGGASKSLAESLGAGATVSLGGETSHAKLVSGRRPLGGTCSIIRGVYESLGTGGTPAPASLLRKTMAPGKANATAAALSGRGPGGISAAGLLLRNVSGGGALPRGVAGFSGAIQSRNVGGGVPIVGKLHLGRPGHGPLDKM